MINTTVGRPLNTSLRRVFSLVLLTALVLPLVTVALPMRGGLRAQPVLLEMAQQHSEATVGVVVQKLVKDTSVEELVGRLGGAVTRDLRMINAFAAELPARAVAELAQAPGVR